MKAYDIRVKSTLLEKKHIEKMGIALWLFIWLLNKSTQHNKDGQGKVLGGKPIRYERDVKHELGISRSTYCRWVEILKKSGYVETRQTPYGLVILVNKLHKKFSKRSVRNDTSRSVTSDTSSRSVTSDTSLSESETSNIRLYSKTLKQTITLPTHQNSQDINKQKALSQLKEKKDKAPIPPNSGDPPLPKRREISYKKEDYDRVIKKYEELRGIKLSGYEYKPIQQSIKTMFMSKRTPEQIMECMEFFAISDIEWLQNWTIDTVKKRIPDFLAGKFSVTVKIPTYAQQWVGRK